MGLWEDFGGAFQDEKHIPNIPIIPNCTRNQTDQVLSGDIGDIGDKGSALTKKPERYQSQASLGVPVPGRPQEDRLKELLLPFQAWPVALALDAAGQIQVRASRLLLEPMREYCLQHEPELQAFLKSCPRHAWRSGEAIRRSGKHEGQGAD